MKTFIFSLLFFFPAALWAQSLQHFNASLQPSAPDYSKPEYWAALPFRQDAADVIPKSETWISDSLKQVDVFYIYPTIYQKGSTWNADVNDEKLNDRIDRLPVKYQASAFNRVGRVYAPRYRQAIIKAYKDSLNGNAALDFAYEDVKRAFAYYMEHYNNGRPVIIASHSQGTTHSRRLIKDFFDTPQTQKQLVCAYIVGFAVFPDSYEVLEPCETPEATGCYVTWASFRNGYTYKKNLPYFGEVCVNPVSWRTDSLPAEGRGGILLGMDKKNPYRTKVQRNGNYLWVKSNIPIVQTWGNQHLVDYNLFWYDIRKNAALRVEMYFKNNKSN